MYAAETVSFPSGTPEPLDREFCASSGARTGHDRCVSPCRDEPPRPPWAPLQRGLAGAELVFWPGQFVEMAVGTRVLLAAEAPTATFRIDFPIGNEMQMGLLAGGGVMAGAFVGQGELSIGLAL